MKFRLAIFVLALFLSLSVVSAVIVNEGDSITIQDKQNDDRTFMLKEVTSTNNAKISIDGVEFDIEAGKFYSDLSNVELFVNDIYYTNKSIGASVIEINEFFVLYEDRANNGDYIFIGGDNDEYSFDLEIISASEVSLIVDSQTHSFAEGEYGEIKGAKFYVEDIYSSNKVASAGMGGVSLGFSEGGIRFRLRDEPVFVEPGECKDSDGLNYYTKGTASGRHWQEFSGEAYVEKTDYCWQASTSNPTATGAYVIDFNCQLNPRTEEIRMVGSIFKCSNGCSDGACIGAPQDEPDPVETNDESAVVDLEEVNENTFVCGSCNLDNKCYPLGYRKDGNYCAESGEFTPQLNSDDACDNNFECESNVCVSGECISDSLLQKILNWFRKLFS